MMKRRQDFAHESFFEWRHLCCFKRKFRKNKFIDFKDTSYLVMNKFNSFDLNDYDDLKILKRIIK